VVPPFRSCDLPEEPLYSTDDENQGLGGPEDDFMIEERQANERSVQPMGTEVRQWISEYFFSSNTLPTVPEVATLLALLPGLPTRRKPWIFVRLSEEAWIVDRSVESGKNLQFMMTFNYSKPAIKNCNRDSFWDFRFGTLRQSSDTE